MGSHVCGRRRSTGSAMSGPYLPWEVTKQFFAKINKLQKDLMKV